MSHFSELLKSQANYIPFIITFLISGLFFLLLVIVAILIANNNKQDSLRKEVDDALLLAGDYQKSILPTVKNILNELALGIFMCDKIMKVKWLNKTACDISGIKNDESIPEDFQLGIDLLFKDTKNAPINIYSSHLNFHQQEGIISGPKTKQSNALINKHLITIAGEEYHIFSIWDLTNRRKIQDELIRSKKLVSIGHHASILMQKFNTPSQFVVPNIDFMLVAIEDIFHVIDKSCSTLSSAPPISSNNKHESIIRDLIDSLNDPEIEYLRKELPAATKQTREGVRQIVELVREIKAVTLPIQTNTIQAVDINSIIHTVIEIAGSKWRKIVRFDLNLYPELYQVTCNENELNNAIYKYLDSRIIGVRENINNLKISDKGTIYIRTKNYKKCIDIYIEDNGASIPPYTSSRIYNPDIKSYKIPKGIQPILSLTEKVICKKLNGSIELHSENETKTIMSIRIPLTGVKQKNII